MSDHDKHRGRALPGSRAIAGRAAPRRVGATARRVAAAAALAMLGAGLPAAACGLEDPTSIAMLRGGLNLAFPESLHVGPAVWQAQRAGRLPADPVSRRADLSPEARGALRLVRANGLVRRLADRLPDAGGAPVPGLAVVLLGPVMWNRYEHRDGRLRVQVHADGPLREDVVVVTDLAVIEALVGGSVGLDEAIAAGWMRLYGSASAVAAVRGWLAGPARG